MRTDIRIVLVFVSADRVWDRVGVCTCAHSFGSCRCMYVQTDFKSCSFVYMLTEIQIM